MLWIWKAVDWKVKIGYALGAVALATLVAASFNIGTAYWLNILPSAFGEPSAGSPAFSQRL